MSMAKEVVETIYGKHHKYEMVQETSTLGSPKYYVRWDGNTSGSFSSLSDAVKWAKDKG
jgi:hypothetical protein